MTLAPIHPSLALDADDLVRDFLGGLSASTRGTYGKAYRALAAWRGLPDERAACVWFLALGQGEANRFAATWRGAMLEGGLSPATAELRVSALRSLVRAATIAGQRGWRLELPPMRGAKVAKMRDTRGPPAEIVARVLAAAEPDELGALRLLVDRGLRVGEVASLRRGDFDRAGRCVWVAGKGRGGQRERVTLAESTCAAIAAAIGDKGDPDAGLFPRWRTGRAVGDMVVRVTRRAGVASFRPHGLRHFAVTAAITVCGGDLRAAQRFSRHRDIRTVAAYDDNVTDLGGEIARKVCGEEVID